MKYMTLLLCFALLACGDDDGLADAGTSDAGVDGGDDDAAVDDAGTDDAGEEDAGAMDGGEPDAGELPTGDCVDESDCDGHACVELTPGGWRSCATEIVGVSGCSDAPGFDECACKGSPVCEGGVACVLGPIQLFCGGVEPVQANQCAIDACQNDGECRGESICLPAPTLGRQVRACFAAACRTNADCTESPGGICAPIQDPCCSIDSVLGCVYEDGCRTSADCDGGMSCQFRDGRGVCTSDPVVCPA